MNELRSKPSRAPKAAKTSGEGALRKTSDGGSEFLPTAATQTHVSTAYEELARIDLLLLIQWDSEFFKSNSSSFLESNKFRELQASYG